MRWVTCWYGSAAVNRPDAGSIPAAAAPPQAVCACGSMTFDYRIHTRKSSGWMRNPFRKQVASSSRLWVQVPRLPLLESSSWKEESETPFLLLPSPLNRAGSSKGRMRRSERRDVGSSPTPAIVRRKAGVRRLKEVQILHRQVFRLQPPKRSRGPATTTPGSRPGNDGSSPSGIIPEPQKSEVRIQYLPDFCSLNRDLWQTRLGRQLADHVVSDTAMLWVRLPPEPLRELRVECPELREIALNE